MDTEMDMVSPFTNRPVKTYVKPDLPVFWCRICEKELFSVTSAFQHMTGRSHKAKAKAKEQTNDVPSKSSKQKGIKKENIPGIKVEKTGAQEPVTKKTKVKEEEKLRCEDCDMEFGSPVTALDHFKGKKHTKKIAAKALTKQNQGQGQGQGRGMGRGNRGGRGFGNRRNFQPRNPNYNGPQRDGDVQLSGIIKGFSRRTDNNMGIGSMAPRNSFYGNSGYSVNNSYGNDDNYMDSYGENSYESKPNVAMGFDDRYASVSNEINDLKRKLSYY